MIKQTKCSIWWCDNKHYALGFCKPHWAAIKRFGHPYGKRRKQLMKIDAEILRARMIALKLFQPTEFAPTEFGEAESRKYTSNPEIKNNITYTWETYDKAITCEYCNSTDGVHEPLCIINLARTLLKNTAGFPNAYVPDGSEMIDAFIEQVKRGVVK